jgi:pyrroline-5-carboxylate reductase
MTEAGVLVGLPRATADALVRQTILGAATLLAGGDESPESLRAAVTSPGGTTAAALHVLESRGVRAALLDAVEAATRRSRETGTSA